MASPIRIGLVGLGGICRLAHFKSFTELPGAEIVAGCDIDEKKFGMIPEDVSIGNLYLDANEMYEKEELDAAVVGTWNSTHAELAISAMKHGLDVLCEKPITVNAEEAARVQAAVKETGRKFMAGMTFRFRPQTPIIQKLIEDGTMGDLYYCKATYLRVRGVPGWYTWFTDKQRSGGGVLIDLGVHLIDYFWFLLGKPKFKSVSAFATDIISRRHAAGEPAGFPPVGYPKTYTGPEPDGRFDVDELTTALIRFDNGAVLNLELAWALNTDEPTMGGYLYGSRAGIDIGTLKLTRDKGEEMVEEVFEFPKVRTHGLEAEQFLEYLRGERENPAPVEDAVEVMRVLDATYQSIEERREIEL